MSSDLIVLRKKIDLIDDQIIYLLDQRFKLSKEVGLLKKKEKNLCNDNSIDNLFLSNIHDSKREIDIINRLFLKQHSLSFDELSIVYNSIFTISKNIQNKNYI